MTLPGVPLDKCPEPEALLNEAESEEEEEGGVVLSDTSGETVPIIGW